MKKEKNKIMGGCKNSEGYTDSTAFRAMKNMNTRPDKITEKARRIRMMSNQGMIEYIENRCNKAKAEGYNQGRKKAIKDNLGSYEEDMEKLMKIRGVGEKLANEILVALHG